MQTAEDTLNDAADTSETDLKKDDEINTGKNVDEGKKPDDDAADENEIVLAGQDGSPPSSANAPAGDSSKDAIIKRMQRKRDRATAENERLKQENLELQRRLAGNQPAQQGNQSLRLPARPTRQQFGYNEEQYDAAMAQWTEQVADIKAEARIRQANAGQREIAAQQNEQIALQQYAKNASALKVTDFNEAQDAALDIVGTEFGMMLARELPEDAPKLMYYFGKNPDKALEYREMFEERAGRTTFELGKLAERLVVKRKQSSAAAAEDRIEGAGVAGASDDLEGQLAKLDDQLDKGAISPAKAISEARRIKKLIKERDTLNG